MRSFTFTLVFLLTGYWGLAAEMIFYVHPEGKGMGTSWSDASNDLTYVLSKARFGDEIWVAKGTYTPSKEGDRRASFYIRDGVRLFGGFSGSEPDRTYRDWGRNPTVLSGEIGIPGIDDNSYNVVFTQNAGPQTVIDGFIITMGNANGEDRKGSRIRCGGGWHDMAANGGVSLPMISNCTFLDNNALEGGAFYANGFNGSSCPTFTNCSFLSNSAKLDGGAIYSDGRDDSTNKIHLINCEFQDNLSSYGGGIYFENGFGETGLVAEKCIFRKNNGLLWGGAIYYSYPNGGFFDFRMVDCRFEENYPTDVNKNRFLSESGQDLAKR